MTAQQHLAATPSHSVWVSASAGTGKTKILVDRLLRLMLCGVEPDQIVCLTFTNAAAMEMSNRIRSKLSTWVGMTQTELEQELSKLCGEAPSEAQLITARQLFAIVVDAPERLRIHTIHGFCQMILRQFPIEAGVLPGFAIMDDLTAKELLSNAQKRVITHASDFSEGVINAIEEISWRLHEGTLQDVLKELIHHRSRLAVLMNLYGSVEAMYSDLCQRLEISPEDSEASLRDSFLDSVDQSAQYLRESAQILTNSTKTDAQRGELLLRYVSDNTLTASQKWELLDTIFLTKSEKKPRASLMTKKPAEAHPEAHELLLRTQGQYVEVSEKINSIHTARVSRHLLHINDVMTSLYEKDKARRGMLDYQDLILKTLNLLENAEMSSWVRFKLDGTIDHLLVDEAQDTSPEQWRIVELLTQEFFAGDSGKEQQRSLFVVGDEKQSIYRFQGASPEMFSRMHEKLSSQAQAAGESWQSVALEQSFRSTPQVLQLVDTLLEDKTLRAAMTNAGEVIHHPFRKHHAGVVELWPLQKAEETEELMPWALPDRYRTSDTPKQKLAQHMAETISQWIESKRLLASKDRAVQAGDILILVRKRDELAESMIRALQQRHVPVAGADRLTLNDHIAVMDMMTVLRFVLQPLDDLNLATLLKSPFIQMDEDTLMQLCIGREKDHLWHYLKSQNHSSLGFLNHVLKASAHFPPLAFLRYVLDNLQGRRKLVTYIGEEAHDPLNELIRLADNFERQHIPTLQGFVQWFDSTRHTIKRDMESSANQVRVMTVHASKGLQAPIVIVPDTTDVPKDRNTIIWTEEGLPFWKMAQNMRPAYVNSLTQMHKEQDEAEYLRLLYVALTRAEDELYITGSSKKEPSARSWYSIVKNAIQNIAMEEDGIWRIGQVTNHTSSDSYETPIIPPLPDWACLTTPDTVVAIQSNLEKKQQRDEAESTYATERGNAVHKLLEILPQCEASLWQELGERIITTCAPQMNTPERQTLLTHIEALLHHADYRSYFQAQGRNEMPVTGTLNGKEETRYIDRVVMHPHEWLVIDYKTGSSSDEARLEKYLQQLSEYYQLLSPHAPKGNVRCLIFWVDDVKMQEVTAQILEKYHVNNYVSIL